MTPDRIFMRTPREESYLWKTTHLNTAEKNEEGSEGGAKDGKKVRVGREKKEKEGNGRA